MLLGIARANPSADNHNAAYSGPFAHDSLVGNIATKLIDAQTIIYKAASVSPYILFDNLTWDYKLDEIFENLEGSSGKWIAPRNGNGNNEMKITLRDDREANQAWIDVGEIQLSSTPFLLDINNRIYMNDFLFRYRDGSTVAINDAVFPFERFEQDGSLGDPQFIDYSLYYSSDQGILANLHANMIPGQYRGVFTWTYTDSI
jgi:hypothetical protein